MISSFDESISFQLKMVYDTKEGGYAMENTMTIKELEPYIIVCFHGELGCQNAPTYRQELTTVLDDTQKNVVFDFSHTTFIDSSGIGLVLGRYNQLKFEHRTLILTGLNTMSYRLFELTGLFQIMPYFETLDDIKEESL